MALLFRVADICVYQERKFSKLAKELNKLSLSLKNIFLKVSYGKILIDKQIFIMPALRIMIGRRTEIVLKLSE